MFNRNLMILFLFYIITISNKTYASPFYITIENSFSPNEDPTLRLDFQDNLTEMELRILKPKNMDNFLDGQLNISRTYEEPSSKLNPGYFVANGLNNIDLPLRKLRKIVAHQFKSKFTNHLSNPYKTRLPRN